MKNLKTPKRQSESVSRRKKEKRTKGQTTIYKILHEKPKIEQYELYQNRCSGRVSSSCSTNGIRHDTVVTYPVLSCIRKWPESAYDKWNISAVFWDTDIP